MAHAVQSDAHMLSRFLQLLLAAQLAACGVLGGDPACEDGKCDAPDAPYPAIDTPAILEIYAFDIWAQYLPQGASITVTRDGTDVPLVGFPLLRAPLEGPGTYAIKVSSPEYRDFEVTLKYDGSTSLRGMPIEGRPEARAAVAASHEMRNVPDRGERTIHTLYTGLSHKWFASSGTPARRGNKLELLMDGEQTYARAYDDLKQATKSIHISTWWWESNFELVRDPATHMTASTTARAPNTIISVLDRSSATKRVIVGQFLGQDGILRSLTVDDQLVARGGAKNDNFEFMGQANESTGTFTWQPEAFAFGERVRDEHAHTMNRKFDNEQPHESFIAPYNVDLTRWPIGVELQHASYHQKFMVLDDKVALIGGANLRRVDWDTSEHKVFDPRRMLFDATTEERQAVANKSEEPDMGPRKDYVVRVEGSAARDAADVFKRRWDLLRTENARFSDASSSFTIATAALPTAATPSVVQVTATLPQPLGDAAIAESWIQAIENATKFIYIEDQYFRMPLVNTALIARMRAVPTLHLVVITKPINEWTDPGCEWTYKSDTAFKTEFPTRYHLFQLRSFDWAVTWGIDETDSFFKDMDTHSKMFIVDDVFMSVGSANKNNRGIIYEGELNLAIYDPAWVREQRIRILQNMLPPGTVVGDNWIQQLHSAAGYNDTVYTNWSNEGWDLNLNGVAPGSQYIPKGFLYSLSFRGSDYCFIENVGPDMT